MRTKVLGRTGLRVPIVGLGGAFLGLPDPAIAARQYQANHSGDFLGDPELARETVIAAIGAGSTLIDTAPLYLAGGSESVIGGVLATLPQLRERVLVTTKVGPHVSGDGYDWSYDETMRSVEESMQRLGMDHLPVVYIHDPMTPPLGAAPPMDFVMGNRGAFGALQKLHDQGVVRFIGVAANDPETAAYYIETGEFDVAVVAQAWSLINRIAERRIFPAAERHNVGLVIATPLERGLLAAGPFLGAEYVVRDFSLACLAHVAMMKTLCDAHGVPLAAAALRWCVRHPQAAATIPGASTAEQARENAEAGEFEIPEAFWKELEPLGRHWAMERK
ncbi:MAG: hypothetical protein A3B37_01735 [Candidatus Sungbacteria bacterium RIFCSPLOWO2_01_FULL_59_16]|uniref:NADP-dependent oxidoreductase domain-containing protein n=1 Tax=Candidatus Sungbacteria bacterium RIFCSPLOWO2_01_FULL_59_16 TaxID=1802280 RepID=A0A1G2LCJ9_9BACT|nr:MAG: hypothetical protein A3B37_01735 [Candidatus Sungbacteria bacterium RIFCSPLOWO2_01_FULL_59_16]